MTIIHTKIQCFRCQKSVSKGDARIIESINKEKRYECFECFKKNKPSWGFGDKIPVKKRYFCERCKYEFKSMSNICPYCNKNSSVIDKFSMKDLL